MPLQQLLIPILPQKLIDLRPAHLSPVRSQFALGLLSRRHQLLIAGMAPQRRKQLLFHHRHPPLQLF